MSSTVQIRGMPQSEINELLATAGLQKHMAGAPFRLQTSKMLIERGFDRDEAYRIAVDIWARADSIFEVSE